MSEIISTPNVSSAPEQEVQANLLLSDIMNNAESISASVENGSYIKTEAENEVREKLEVKSESSGIRLEASRDLIHDPEWNLSGKYTETLKVYASIPQVAAALVITVAGKTQAVEYSDPYGKKGIDGLEDALEAIQLAVEELQSSTS